MNFANSPCKWKHLKENRFKFLPDFIVNFTKNVVMNFRSTLPLTPHWRLSIQWWHGTMHTEQLGVVHGNRWLGIETDSWHASGNLSPFFLWYFLQSIGTMYGASTWQRSLRKWL